MAGVGGPSLRGHGCAAPARGVWGHAPPGKFWNLHSLRVILAQSVGKNYSLLYLNNHYVLLASEAKNSLSQLMKIAIESPERLSDDDLENIFTIWSRKPRKIAV